MITDKLCVYYFIISFLFLLLLKRGVYFFSNIYYNFLIKYKYDFNTLKFCRCIYLKWTITCLLQFICTVKYLVLFWFQEHFFIDLFWSIYKTDNFLFIKDIYLVHLFICRIFMVLDSYCRWISQIKIRYTWCKLTKKKG
jgi:hypothetical protein